MMLGLLFALAVACPHNQQPCVDPHAPPPAYAPGALDQRPDYEDERDSRNYRDRYDYRESQGDRDDRAYAGQDTTRETATSDGYIRETWGPNGYVREHWGNQSSYEQNGAAKRHTYRDGRDRPDYHDDRRYRDGRGYDAEPGVYDRYGGRYKSGSRDHYEDYGHYYYDPRCDCWCRPTTFVGTMQPPVQAETVDLGGWGAIGGVGGDYYGGGGGFSGYNMNGVSYGSHGSGLGAGIGRGFGSGRSWGNGSGQGSATSSSSASASASASASINTTIRFIGGGGVVGGGGKHR